MAHRRGLIPRARGPKRLTNWGVGPGGTAALGITSSTAALLGSGIVVTAAGTIVRLRGHFAAFLTSYTTAGDGYQGAVAIGIASTPAFAAGIASLPSPITESEWDGWMWHNFFGVHGQVVAGSAAGAAAPEFSVAVDSKAMRKMSDQMTMFAAVEVVEIGTAVIQMHFDSRLLFMEG